MAAIKQDSFQHNCFNTEETASTQTPGLLIDSHNRKFSQENIGNFGRNGGKTQQFDISWVRKMVRPFKTCSHPTKNSLDFYGLAISMQLPCQYGQRNKVCKSLYGSQVTGNLHQVSFKKVSKSGPKSLIKISDNTA